MRLLVVEDDPQLGPSLARGLRERAYAVDLVRDGREAARQAVLNDYDAIILDVMLPERDGFAVARLVRGRGVHAPILMLTARDSVADRVAGLDAGADDYLVKPFSFDELLARLRALTRRQSSRVLPTIITVGAITIDTRTQRVTRNGVVVVLTAKEYALLTFLARHEGTVLSRADITGHVWDDNHDPASNNLEVYINRLRRKLDDGVSSLIQTRRGAGYVLSIEPPVDP